MSVRRLRTVLLPVAFLLLASGSFGQNFAGIGAAVVPVATGELVVVKVVEGSPAAAGGLLPGDLIVQVDGHALKGTEFSAIVSKFLWGPPGTAVTLVYRRPGRSGEHKVALQRVAMDPDAGQTPGVKLLVPEAGGNQGGR